MPLANSSGGVSIQYARVECNLRVYNMLNVITKSIYTVWFNNSGEINNNCIILNWQSTLMLRIWTLGALLKLAIVCWLSGSLPLDGATSNCTRHSKQVGAAYSRVSCHCHSCSNWLRTILYQTVKRFCFIIYFYVSLLS